MGGSLVKGGNSVVQRICLNADWRFHLGEVADGGYQGLSDGDWRVVTLPHDWAVEHPFDENCSSGTGYLPGGVGWYRKHFTLPEGALGKRVTVTFGGVYKNSRCYINSNYLGMRPYGYSTFRYDISEFVKPGDNVLCVRCEHVDLADSRWYTGNGITRDVTLAITEHDCFEDDGVFAYTARRDDAGAEIAVEWRAIGAGDVRFTLMDAAGARVASASASGSGGRETLRVDGARLWSPDDPYLYTLSCALHQGGVLCDEISFAVGVRTIRFDAEKGFFLNDIPMKLKGVCVHHDAGALGAAVPKAVWRRRLEKFKAAGCNAVRFSHNPPDVPLIDLCDEMGFLTIDEAFDEWEGCKNKWWHGHNVYPPKHFGYSDDFPVWHEADLTAMVRRDRNHPSVILWSIGNEIDYPNDPYVHPSFAETTGNNDANKPKQERKYDPFKPNAERLATVARALCAIVKRHDGTRPVTSALAFPELSLKTGYAHALDVAGFNYKEALYGSTHRDHPAMALLGTENSHSAEAWRAVTDNEYIAGQFLWTGVDFLGEAHGWPIRVSTAGILTLAGFEKPRYYQRMALWTDKPVCALATSEDGTWWREAPLWEYADGQEVSVSCYTNAERAELFLNGASLDAKTLTKDDGCRAVWRVKFAPGELRCVCSSNKETLAEDALFTSVGKLSLSLSPRVEGDIAQVEVLLSAESGAPATSRDQALTYAAEGAEIMGVENGDPADLTPYTARTRATFYGRAIAYLRLTADTARLTVSSDTVGAQTVTLSRG